MAGHVLSITNVTRTITLTSGDYYVSAYSIRQAEKGAEGVYQPVTEQISLAIRGSNLADMRDNVRALQVLLDEASRENGEYVYLQANLLSDTSTWKARILDARMDPLDNIMRVYSNLVTEYTLTLTREPVFRGALTTATWSGGGTTKSMTNGRGYILNSIDTFVETPAIVTLTNLSTNRNMRRIWVSNDYVTGFAGANDSRLVGGSGTATSDTHDSFYAKGTLNYADAFGGREWRVFTCLDSGTVGLELKTNLMYVFSLSYKRAQSGLPSIISQAGGQVLDGGTFVLPPAGRGPAASGVGLSVSAWGSGSFTVGEFVMMPAFNVRQYDMARPSDYLFETNTALVDDPRPLGGAYWLKGASEYPFVRTSGKPIMLMPNKTNRVAFLAEEASNYDGDFVLQGKIQYEKQRLLI